MITLPNMLTDITREEHRAAFIAGVGRTNALQLLLPWVITQGTNAIEVKDPGLNAPPGYRRRTTTGPVVATAMQKNFTQTYEQVDFEQAIEMDYKTALTLPAETLTAYYALFGNGAIHCFVREMFDLINYGSSTSYLQPDGVPFFSESHPSNVGNQSNRYNSALDSPAYEAAQRMLGATKGPDGQEMSLMANILMVSKELEHVGYRVNGPGTLVPTPPTGGSFTYAGQNPSAAMGIGQVTSPWITEPTRWALGDTNVNRARAFVLKAFSAVFGQVPGSPDYKMWDVGSFSKGFSTWRGWVGGGTNW